MWFTLRRLVMLLPQYSFQPRSGPSAGPLLGRGGRRTRIFSGSTTEYLGSACTRDPGPVRGTLKGNITFQRVLKTLSTVPGVCANTYTMMHRKARDLWEGSPRRPLQRHVVHITALSNSSAAIQLPAGPEPPLGSPLCAEGGRALIFSGSSTVMNSGVLGLSVCPGPGP